MSYFAAEVVKLPEMIKHPNADNLSVFSFEKPYRFTYVGRTEDWVGKDRAVFIPVDALVGDQPEFEFLGKHRRITARKIRGIFSMGLLVPARTGWEIGQDVTKELGITKYEDSLESKDVQNNLQSAPGPSGGVVYTDVESLRKYPDVFQTGDQVVVLEKIHGENFRACYQNNTLYVGSRTRWLRESNNNWWKSAFNAGLPEILQSFPDKIFFGEQYGYVQDMRYGMAKGEVKLIFFDIYDIGRGAYLDFNETVDLLNKVELEMAPVLYNGRWPGYQTITRLAEEPSAIHPNGKNVRAGKMIKAHPESFMEGVVVKTSKETFNENIGRKILKYHSENFLSRKKKD